MRHLKLFGTVVEVVFLGLCASFAWAEPNSQIGEVQLEEYSGRKDPYPAAQDETIASFRRLESAIESGAKGSPTRLEPLSDDSENYLSGAYLYCAVNTGTCSVLLEAILEFDVINSRLDGKASCPNMKRFWNFWVKNGLEERHKYLVRTSFINDTTKFNSQERPKFLKCETTVQQIVQGIPSNEAFFKDRYRSGSPQATLGTRAAALLEQLKQKVPNVFVATGAQKTPFRSDSGEGKKIGTSGSGKPGAARKATRK